MEKINLNQKFGLFTDQWSPKVIADLNGQHVKLAKIQGEFVWHHHQDEDELFYILRGSLKIELRDRVIALEEGEMFVVPKGVEHRPIAEEEVWIMLMGSATIKHTGNVRDPRTVDVFERI